MNRTTLFRVSIGSVLRISTTIRIALGHKYSNSPKSRSIVLAIEQTSPIDLSTTLFW